MKDSEKNKVDLAKALRTSGFLLPADESEVEAFEKNLEEDSNEPIDWDNPLNIIARGKVKKVELKSPDVDEGSVENLSMAAREGKGISENVRKRMNEDRKQSK